MLFALEDCRAVRLARVSDLLEIESIRPRRETGEVGRTYYFPSCSCATDVGALSIRTGNRRQPDHDHHWELTYLILTLAQTSTSSSKPMSGCGPCWIWPSITQYFWASFWYWSETMSTNPGWHRSPNAGTLPVRATAKRRRASGARSEIYAQLMWRFTREPATCTGPERWITMPSENLYTQGRNRAGAKVLF